MNREGIVYRLSIYVISSSIIVATIIIILCYSYTRHVLMQSLKENAISQSDLVIYRLHNHIITTQEVTRNVSKQSLYFLQHNDLELFLKDILKTNVILNKIHVGFKKDSFIKEKYDYTTLRVSNRDSIISYVDSDKFNLINYFPNLYEQIEKSPSGFWTKPFIPQNTSHEYFVAYCYPIKQEGNDDAIGFVSCFISMNDIDSIMSNMKIKKGGFTFITDRTGLFLTHPNKNWGMKKTISGLTTDVLPSDFKSLKEQILSGQRGDGFCYPEYYNYKETWFYCTIMPYTGWVVIVLIPSDVFFHDLWVFFEKITGIILIGIFLLFLIFIYIFRRILSPLKVVTKSIHEFSSEGKTKKVKNEVDSLVDSLNKMQHRVTEYKQEQDQTREEKKKQERDLKSAKEIQQAIIPAGYPAFPNRKEFDIYGILRPAYTIGGDSFDYFFIDKKHLLFVIGDVSGKGISASIFMAIVDTTLKNNISVFSSREFTELLNQKISLMNTNEFFVTGILGVLDTETGNLDYCNSAHCYPYILKNNGDIKYLEQTHGLPLGLFPEKSYKSSIITLEPEDVIFFYTDGVTDCLNENDEFYGQKRLKKELKKVGLCEKSCLEIVCEIEDSLTRFKGNAAQVDDISIMALKYKGKRTKKNESDYFSL